MPSQTTLPDGSEGDDLGVGLHAPSSPQLDSPEDALLPEESDRFDSDSPAERQPGRRLGSAQGQGRWMRSEGPFSWMGRWLWEVSLRYLPGVPGISEAEAEEPQQPARTMARGSFAPQHSACRLL